MSDYTAAQFAEDYAQRSGVTVQWLKDHDREPRPCRCGELDCRGWQMARLKIDGDWPEGSAFPTGDPRYDRGDALVSAAPTIINDWRQLQEPWEPPDA
jgi:hypothetical protein